MTSSLFPPPPPGAQHPDPDLIETRRLLFLGDGRCLGCFTTKSTGGGSPHYSIPDPGSPLTGDSELLPVSENAIVTSAILLEANGASFSHVASDGEVHRHLTRFPFHHLSSKVEAMIRFRNRYSARPYLTPTFYRSKVASQDLSRRVKWSAGVDKERQQVSVQRDMKPVIHSSHGKAQVILEHGTPCPLLHARYVAEVPGEDPISAQYSAPKDRRTQPYVTWTDTWYRPQDTHPAFASPTALLLQTQTSPTHPPEEPLPQSQPMEELTLPEPLPVDPPAQWSDLESGDGLLAFDLLEMGRDPHRFPKEAVVADMGSGGTVVVVLEENEDGLYWARTGSDGQKVVDVWVTRDGSYLRVEGGFVQHFRGAGHGGGGDEKVYHLEAAKHIRVPYGLDSWYDLGIISQHASGLLSQYKATPTPIPTEPSPSSPLSGPRGVVVEEVTISCTGVFRAFSCGRVRVRFQDRTILDLLPSEGVCRLLLPDAQEVEIPLNRWHGPDEEYYTRYGSAAVQFARWAFLGPAERDQREAETIQRSNRIAHEIQRSYIHTQQYRIAKSVFERRSGPTCPGPRPPETPPEWAEPHSSPSPPKPQRQRREEALELIRGMQQRNEAHMAEVKRLLRKPVQYLQGDSEQPDILSKSN